MTRWSLGRSALWLERGSARCIFGFVIGPWEVRLSSIGSTRKSRNLYVFFGPWTWRTELVRQIENGDEI